MLDWCRQTTTICIKFDYQWLFIINWLWSIDYFRFTSAIYERGTLPAQVWWLIWFQNKFRKYLNVFRWAFAVYRKHRHVTFNHQFNSIVDIRCLILVTRNAKPMQTLAESMHQQGLIQYRSIETTVFDEFDMFDIGYANPSNKEYVDLFNLPTCKEISEFC